jgi:anti-anti-sigma factor
VTGLEVSLRHDGDVALLRLHGEARQEVIHNLSEQAQKAVEGGAKSLILDCARLAFMDSASTGALIRLEQEVSGRGGRLVLHSVPRVIHRMLGAAGLDGRFRLARDEEQARSLVLGA